MHSALKLHHLLIMTALSIFTAIVPALATAGVGFTREAIADPMAENAAGRSGGKLEYAIWYPSDVASGVSTVGPYEFEATTDAAVADGRYPLIALSHGSGGTPFGHRNLAIALANAGFIAVAPLHPRDNFRDSSGVGHRIVWDGRPIQVRAVIDQMLESPTWAAHVDASRIGAFGFSLGGYTVLALIGAQPSMEELIRHCDAHHSQDPLCKRGGGMANAMRRVMKNEYQTPAVNLHDTRICAAVVADPVAAIFPVDSLAKIQTSSLTIYLPEHENEVAAQFHGLKVERALAKQGRVAVDVKRVDNAQHYSFIAPFPESVARSLPAIFKNSPDFDADKFHLRMEREVVSYFSQHLQHCAQQ